MNHLNELSQDARVAIERITRELIHLKVTVLLVDEQDIRERLQHRIADINNLLTPVQEAVKELETISHGSSRAGTGRVFDHDNQDSDSDAAYPSHLIAGQARKSA